LSALPLPPELPDFDDEPASPPPMRVLAEDGTLHYSDLKKIALSGRQYLYGVNNPTKPTAAMLLGTCAHMLVLGPRKGAKPLRKFEGKARRGKAWEDFEERWGATSEILTAPEWERAERIAEAVLADPVALARLEGATFEVPLEWEESGIRCSTSGLDIVRARAVGDFKSTITTFPDAWTRHAFKMLYPMQLAFYRRGARANGLDVSEGLFLLGVETKPPYEVVDLELTEAMIDFADRTVSLWLEKLRGMILSCPEPRHVTDWPGYMQAPVPWDVPSWHRDEEEDEEEEESEEDAA
jgi:hypothetical protein